MFSIAPINLTKSNKSLRALWRAVWFIFGRFTPIPFHFWRVFILKLFGCRVGIGVHIYPTAKIWAPWNLTIGDRSCIAGNVDVYNVSQIIIGHDTTISQYSYLCTASHNYNLKHMPLVGAPIYIGDYVWVTADVFIAPGVSISEGAVILARSTVLSDIPNWVAARGNPAVVIKKREMIDRL